MNISKLTFMSALVAASAVTAQTTHFTGTLSKDPAGVPNAAPSISGFYDFLFNNTTGAITGIGGASTVSASVLNPGPAVSYAIDTVRILEGTTTVLSFSAGTATVTSVPSGATRQRAKSDYSFAIGGSLGGNKTYHFEFLKGGSKVASSATFTTPALVPEPETYAAAAALGLVGFGLWRRRNA